MDGALLIDFARAYPKGPTIEAAARLMAAGATVTVLFGPSGAGKTTVLRAIAGLDRPDSGRIAFDGETWFDAATRTWVPPERRGIGYVSQDPALFPHMSVAANLAYGLRGADAGERRRRVAEVVALLGLAGLEGRHPRALSAGERQRVALGRAISRRPRLLLLDEPLSSLDAPARERLRAELRGVVAALDVPTILVTHDRVEALALGDEVAVLAEGRIHQVGPIAEVFSRPASLAVASTVGVETVVPARILSASEGLVEIAAGAARLVAVAPAGGAAPLPTEAFACIRAEEVVVEPGAGAPSSARNHLAGRIVEARPEGPLVRLAIDCGFRLVAFVTRRSHEDLGLREGAQVTASIKAPAVRLVPREGARAG